MTMPPVPRFKNFNNSIFEHAKVKGITLNQSGKQGGDVAARLRKKYMEEEALLNEHLREHPLVAARKRSLGYASENLDSELKRLQGLGYMKSSAYIQGFMLKVAEAIDRTKTTSVLKPSILYNKRSMMIRMKKSAQATPWTDLRPQPNKQAQGPSNGDPNIPLEKYRKKSKMEKYLSRK
jgi:hypothetical protein